MKKHISLILVAALWLGLTAFAWVKPADESSDSERRNLAQFPELSVETLLSGKFMTKFADYAVDQFPLRETFRGINAQLTYKLLGQKDNNDIYVHDGWIAKMEYPLNETSINYAVARFDDIYRKYLAGTKCNIVFSWVPDKSYYLADDAGVLKMDYEKLDEILSQKLKWAEVVDISDTLTLDSYYRTDTHWRQESIFPVVEKLASALNIPNPGEKQWSYESATQDFYGVYYGQAALPMAPESLNYVTWDGWQDCTVYFHDTGREMSLYDMSKLSSKDPYEIFLSGNNPLQTIINPHAGNDRELVIFRDSFGSSIAPLLAMEYSKVTLVDTRYMMPAMIGQYLKFDNQDVLFLYSTLILNSSTALKK